MVALAVRWRPPHAALEADTPFLFPIVGNGAFVALTGLAVIQPYLLPVAVGLLTGDAIAGQAGSGTLRLLLTRPVPRARLVLATYASTMTVLAIVVAGVALAGTVAGGWAFGLGPLPTLSGTELPTAAALGRVALSAAFVVAAASGVASIGIWISTETDSGPGAAALAVTVAIASGILDRLPSLLPIHRWLPTHGWLGFVDLFRFPVQLTTIERGLLVSGAYTVAFLALAVARFDRRDVLG